MHKWQGIEKGGGSPFRLFHLTCSRSLQWLAFTIEDKGIIKNIFVDLQHKNPNAKGLSQTNIYYAKKFYLLYSKYAEFVPQTAGQLEGADKSHVSTSEIVPQVLRYHGLVPFSPPLFATYFPPISIGTSLEPDWNLIGTSL